MFRLIKNSRHKINPPQNVNSVLLNPCINAADEAKAQRDQSTPGIITTNANTAEKGTSINWTSFNKVKTASTTLIQINASKNFPFPLNILPPKVIITEKISIWKTWLAVKYIGWIREMYDTISSRRLLAS